MAYILTNGESKRLDRIDYTSHGNNYRLALITASGYLVLKCDAQTVVNLLEPIVLNAKASLGQVAPGHMRGNDA